MNLLEHYIKEVIKVTECKTEKGTKYLKVNMVCDCYGVVEEKTELFLYEDWQKVKGQGYYMA